jgi:hypothetical protein
MVKTHLKIFFHYTIFKIFPPIFAKFSMFYLKATTTRSQLYKTFLSIFTHSFCKLDSFIILHYLTIAIKQLISKRVSKFNPEFLSEGCFQ